MENGPKELEQLFRTIVFHPAAPILIADNDRKYREASVGAGKLLGLPREQIIGRSVDDFAAPAIKPVIPERWQTLLKEGEQSGTLEILSADGTPREVEYTAKTNVLPVRHLLVLRDKTKPAEPDKDPSLNRIPSWVEDYALFLIGVDGKVVAWYAGAERIYGYPAGEAIGRHVSFLYPAEDTLQSRVQEELVRTASEGHKGTEGWCLRKDASQFWANAITMALRDGNGVLQGFARVVRDFSDRHARDEKLRRSRARVRPIPAESTIAGVVSGEFDRIPEANDTFLELIGYSRADLLAGRLVWPDLTPPEYLSLDELAHEEALRFGACTPFEKELIRKDGTRVPVLVTTAVLQLSPFRWITFVTDLRERDRQENVEDEVPESVQDFGEIVGTSSSLKR
ncbi:MAG TPA: PAS domain S-box protein, partial [Bryobacteraceae bacterium]|nr:PAS domain S-box protein [Bryobacteraceae bacterium]